MGPCEFQQVGLQRAPSTPCRSKASAVVAKGWGTTVSGVVPSKWRWQATVTDISWVWWLRSSTKLGVGTPCDMAGIPKFMIAWHVLWPFGIQWNASICTYVAFASHKVMNFRINHPDDHYMLGHGNSISLFMLHEWWQQEVDQLYKNRSLFCLAEMILSMLARWPVGNCQYIRMLC